MACFKNIHTKHILCFYLVYYYFLQISQGNFRMCKLLLSKGANWKKKDKEGQKALHLATRHQNTKCLGLIMKHLEPGEVDEQDNANVSAFCKTIAFRSCCISRFPKVFSTIKYRESKILAF